MSTETVENGTAPETTDAPAQRTLSDAELLQFLQLKQEAQKRADAAEKAKAERKRLNGRGVDPATGKEYTAPVAFLMHEATLISNWLDAYQKDPQALYNRMRDQFLPMITALANTPSGFLGAAFDTRRREMDALRAGPPVKK